MRSKTIIILVGLVVIAIIAYTFFNVNTFDPEAYKEEIVQWQNEQNEVMHNAEQTPIPDSLLGHFDKLSYFPIDESYRIEALFGKIMRDEKVYLRLSDGKTRRYKKYGRASFELNGMPQKVVILKPLEKNMGDYLFLPFFDETSTKETYGGGRFLEPELIDDNTILIDFNKAYNPYCAYGKDIYSCPLPPAENRITVKVEAGEKMPDFVTH